MSDTTELVGVTDIADRYGVVQPAVSAWTKRPTFPEPAIVLTGPNGRRGGHGGPGQVRRLWHVADIEQWYLVAVERGEVRRPTSEAR